MLPYAPLHPVIVSFPNELVKLSIIGPFPATCEDNKYMLLLVDYFTKWCKVIPLKVIDVRTVAVAIIKKSSVDLVHPINCSPIMGQILKVHYSPRCVVPLVLNAP